MFNFSNCMLLRGDNPIDSKVSAPELADMLAKGKAGGYPADIKLIYSCGGNLFNQAPNANKMAQNLDGVEFIVGQDHFLTPTTRYAPRRRRLYDIAATRPPPSPMARSAPPREPCPGRSGDLRG